MGAEVMLEKGTKEEMYDFLLAEQEKFYRLAFHYVKEKEAAMDVVQEAVASALASYDKLKEKKYLKTWFFRILVNSAIDYINNNKKYVLTDDFLIYENGTTCETANADKIDLDKALDSLPISLRTILILRYFEDMKISEIAIITNTPESTVKSRIKSALDKLSIII